MLSNSRVVCFALAISLSVAGCARDARVAQLERRVDSLAVTLTALVNARRGGDAPSLAESLTVSLSGAAAAGDPHAPVVIVEFTDYQCPFCGRHFETTLPEIRARYLSTGKVRYIVRDFPLSDIHPNALGAAKAARCAAAQDTSRYWQFHDALFKSQKRISPELFPQLARLAGLNLPQFQVCVASPQTAGLIERDATEARRAGLAGTPAFIIGRATGDSVHGVLIRGAYPFALFQQAIEGALAAPPANGIAVQ
jgi:protein-disulfide isomerase